MTPLLPPFALVRLPCLDVRRSPDHRSELKSQFLLGEIVAVRRASRDRRWWWSESTRDGYRGWVRNWGLIPATRREAASWRRRATGRIVAALDEARADPGGGDSISPLAWSGRVITGALKQGYRRIELPDGRSGWVAARSVRETTEAPADLWERVRDFLGAPYLWGGRTPMGINCSAFVQLLLAEWGVRFPRDTRDQYLVSRPLRAGESPRPGDLLFFAAGRGRIGHVAVALEEGCYAHARGWVRVNSIESDNPLYDSELHGQFRGHRRVAGRRVPRIRSWFAEPAPT